MKEKAEKMAEKKIEINSFLITTYLTDAEISKEVMIKEYEMTNSWKESGLIEHLFAKIEKGTLGGGILLMKVKSLEEAESNMKKLPLYPFFDKVDYLAVDKIY